MSDVYDNINQIIEAAIFAAGEPIGIDKLSHLFAEEQKITTAQIRKALEELAEKYQNSGVELISVGSGYRFQSRAMYAPWLQRLWEKKPPRYSRALMETLALIVYKQPITRGDIEQIRGVTVSTNIIKILQEREWVKIVGHRDVPGKPALFGTTKEFLDYFNLEKLSDLPPLQDLINIDELEQKLGQQLALAVDGEETADTVEEAETGAETEVVQETAEVMVEAEEPAIESTETRSEEAVLQRTEEAEENLMDEEAELVPVGV